MKRLLSLVISFSVFISIFPVITIGAGAAYGTMDNPILLDSDNPFVFYEAEDYPIVNSEFSNYGYVEDADASGGYAIKRSEAIEYDDLTTTGDQAQYRLFIKSEKESKVKIFLRIKLLNEPRWENARLTKITCAKNNDPVMDRSHYVNEQGKYYWVCSDSYEISAGEEFAFSLILSSERNYIDKIFVTSDLMTFPVDKSDEISTELNEYFDYMSNYYDEIEYDTPISSHPRVLVNSNTLPAIRENLTKEENIRAYNSLMVRADTAPTSYAFQNVKGYVLTNAFLSVLSDNAAEKETRANNAKNVLLESLKLKSNLLTDRSQKKNLNEVIYRIFYISLVYDWCYDYISKEEKDILISNIVFYMAQQEFTYPPILSTGVINGHESEGEYYAGLLPAAIAIYDEYPDMYKVVGPKIITEHIPTRNYYYEIGNHTQGTHYMRMTYEFYLKAIMNCGVKKGLVNDGADKILMEYIYGLRPDNQIMRNGDHSAIGTREGISLNSTSLFFNSNYNKNPYLKDLYYRISPVQSFDYDLTSISEPLWLIFNDPSLEIKSRNELPLVYYAGDKAGVMYARTSWDEGTGAYSDTMAVRLNLETIYGAGHDHLDAGHFDIYYKGSLALDSGFYPGMGGEHYRNYYIRTIAHNCMLLYDPNEKMTQRYSNSVNDGGQIHKASAGGSADTLFERQKIGEILAADYGEDMYNPSFAYMKGDLTDAYSSDKMENYTRSFVYLNFFDEIYPGSLIVFDKMTSKNPDFKKTWLLHTQEEPEINGENILVRKTEEGDNGRLINTTLLPKAEDCDITKVGGYDMRFSTNGINYQRSDAGHAKDFGEWRMELSPKTSKSTDYFLNVLQVSENDNSIEPLTPVLIEADNFVGVKVKNRVVFFNKSDDDASCVSFTLSGDEEYEILVTGLSSGKWSISSTASKYDTSAIATENGSNILFKGTSGTYSLKKDNDSSESLIKNFDYKNYIVPSEKETSYIRFNGIYHTADFFEENDKLYVDSEAISKHLSSPLTIENNKLTYYLETQSLSLDLNSDDVIFKNGIYFVNVDALRELFFVNWEKNNDYIYNITLKRRTEIKITTGAEFDSTSFNDSSALYIIEGEDELPDGTYGIKLPDNYASKSGFAGVIKGVDNKNNICLTSGKPLFSLSANVDYTAFENLNLKGTNDDGSGIVTADNRFTGVLVNQCKSYSDYDKHVLVFKDIENHLDIIYPESYNNSVCYAGGIVGYIQYKDTYVDNCVNYGNINAAYNDSGAGSTSSGGLVAATRYGRTTIINSANHGDILSDAQAGGIHGYSYGSSSIVNILYCANYGDISSDTHYCIGGLAGLSYGGVVEKSFNLGNVSGTLSASGIVGQLKSGTLTISDTYNAGNISAKQPKNNYYTCGIASRENGTLVIHNSYNIGALFGNKLREISNVTSDCSGNYYTNQYAIPSENIAGTYIEKEKLATSLPFEFSPLIWEYTLLNDENKYALPQIIGNNCISTNEDFYMEKAPVSVAATDYVFVGSRSDSAYVDRFTDSIITAPFAVVPAKFSYLSGVLKENIEYGVLIADTLSGDELTYDNCQYKAEGVRNVNGLFGVLICGNLKSGTTYYVRPYAVYDGKCYYGECINFILNEK